MGAQNIVKEIKQYQKWLQHVQRMDTNRLPKQALQYKPKGRRNMGQPRKRWRDQLHLEDQGTGNTPNPSGTWWWRWKNFYADILAGRIQAQNVVHMQTRICIRCVTYDVKVSRDSWNVSNIWRRRKLVWLSLLSKVSVLDSYGKFHYRSHI